MKSEIHILVTGANGQLGKVFQSLQDQYSNLIFHFEDSKTLDICDFSKVGNYFNTKQIHFCINCAAYTAVDRAEEEKDLAYKINAEAVKYLAETCKKHSTVLIHISTDFVFNGDKNTPYTEDDITNPINVYGSTKLAGENYIRTIAKAYFIVRTSWLYSEYGNNFVKTMLRLATTKDELSIVSDQKGSPTYARDLALFILKLITENRAEYGTYHYANVEETNWYSFANAIFSESDVITKTNEISATQYKTPAQRPAYSVLDTNKTVSTFNIKITTWLTSLRMMLKNNERKL